MTCARDSRREDRSIEIEVEVLRSFVPGRTLAQTAIATENPATSNREQIVLLAYTLNRITLRNGTEITHRLPPHRQSTRLLPPRPLGSLAEEPLLRIQRGHSSSLVPLPARTRTPDHIQHLSTSPKSPLHPSSSGSAFYTNSTPLAGEPCLTMSVNSAFTGTSLEELLREHEIRRLYIAGLTTDHCVSTTTRMAGNLHVTDYVNADGKLAEGDVVLIGDATAAWEKPDGEWDAEVVHAVHLESLKEFARVV